MLKWNEARSTTTLTGWVAIIAQEKEPVTAHAAGLMNGMLPGDAEGTGATQAIGEVHGSFYGDGNVG